MTSLVAAVADSLKRKPVRIGTHSGTFHADEALGCFMLRETQAFKGAEVVRTRSPEVLKDLDVIIDVGGVYDPSEPSLGIVGILVLSSPHAWLSNTWLTLQRCACWLWLPCDAPALGVNAA